MRIGADRAISADKAREDPLYQDAQDIRRVAILATPFTIILGYMAMSIVLTPWAIRVWVALIGLNIMVVVGCEVVKLFAFGRNLRRQRRELEHGPSTR